MASAPARFNEQVAGQKRFLKSRTRVRFLHVREDLSVWCRELGVRDDALESLVWEVVALVDAPASELVSLLRRRVPALAVNLDKSSSIALAQRLRSAAIRGEVRFTRS